MKRINRILFYTLDILDGHTARQIQCSTQHVPRNGTFESNCAVRYEQAAGIFRGGAWDRRRKDGKGMRPVLGLDVDQQKQAARALEPGFIDPERLQSVPERSVRDTVPSGRHV
ncbi:hypothetical protein SKAU_G00394090 [Synaphobranchus kaupii]|uniref:Uncharacterized protein n=1 Tax=Synaphobranchus kaupii TaxID=118154 RepID=A0A9Q1EC68_SYNKA|nr:hypothetical protein SKAU_G00394090 [Synaphobranchus kaupii]